jgi:hypothetical protein
MKMRSDKKNGHLGTVTGKGSGRAFFDAGELRWVLGLLDLLGLGSSLMGRHVADSARARQWLLRCVDTGSDTP